MWTIFKVFSEFVTILLLFWFFGLSAFSFGTGSYELGSCPVSQAQGTYKEKMEGRIKLCLSNNVSQRGEEKRLHVNFHHWPACKQEVPVNVNLGQMSLFLLEERCRAQKSHSLLPVTLSGFDSKVGWQEAWRNLSCDVWEVGSREKPFYLFFF